MNDMLESNPCDTGLYLVVRNRHGQRWFEILPWDGRFWVTGVNDDPDAMVEAWCQLPPPSEWRHFDTAFKKMNESLDKAIGNFVSF